MKAYVRHIARVQTREISLVALIYPNQVNRFEEVEMTKYVCSDPERHETSDTGRGVCEQLIPIVRCRCGVIDPENDGLGHHAGCGGLIEDSTRECRASLTLVVEQPEET